MATQGAWLTRWIAARTRWLAPAADDLGGDAPGCSRARQLLVVSVLHMLCHGLLQLITPLYVAIQTDFGLARIEPVTALMTWIQVTFALATLAAGLLVDRLPTRWIAGLGLALQGLGLFGMAHAPTLGWARAWLIVSAIGASGYHPVSARLIIGLYPDAVGRAMGLVGIGAGLGFFFGPLYSGWRAELAGWRAPMLEAGLAAMVLGAAYLVLTREPVLSGGVGRRERAIATRRDKALLVLLLGAVGVAAIPRDYVGIGVEALGSVFLQRSYLLGVAATGAVLGAKGLISLVTNPLLAALSDRGHRLVWWAGTIAASAVCAALVPYLSPAAGKVALVLHGVFMLANYPIFEAALLERVPARIRGRAYAMILAIVGLAAAWAPKLVGRQVDALVDGRGAVPPAAFQPLFVGLAGVLLLSLGAAVALAALGRRDDGTAPR